LLCIPIFLVFEGAGTKHPLFGPRVVNAFFNGRLGVGKTIATSSTTVFYITTSICASSAGHCRVLVKAPAYPRIFARALSTMVVGSAKEKDIPFKKTNEKRE
jgi:hypothetical protein